MFHIIATRQLQARQMKEKDQRVKMMNEILQGIKVRFWNYLGWAGLGWAGLGWAGLGWAGLGWAGLGWAGLGWLDPIIIVKNFHGCMT
jgi:Lamprin